MDFAHPIQAIIPGAQGRVLAVLAEVTTDLNLRTIARLSGLSPAHVSRVLHRLVELGLVERRDVGGAALFRLVAEHMAGRVVLTLARAREGVVAELSQAATELQPPAAGIVLFGSFARGEAGPGSDLDVLVVRPAGIDSEDEAWGSSLERWRRHATRLTGNPVQVIEVGEEEVTKLARSRRSVWEAVRVEGVVIAGRPLAEISGA
jgi:DNA-binding transcriptional ArsR family regulator